MNKSTRKDIEEIIDQLKILKSHVELIENTETLHRDNLPANFHKNKQYQKMEDAISCLSFACSGLDEVIDDLNNAIQ